LITSALLHAPQVLFLDEPLSGLDAHAAVLVKKLLRALADQGWTIFYSSHALDVVQQVCDRIIILDEGKVVAAGTYDELARTSGARNLEGLFTQLTDRGDEESRLASILQGLR